MTAAATMIVKEEINEENISSNEKSFDNGMSDT